MMSITNVRDPFHKAFGFVIASLVLALCSACVTDVIEIEIVEPIENEGLCQEGSTDSCLFEGFYYYRDEENWLNEMSGDYLLIGIDSAVSDEEIENFVSSQGLFSEISTQYSTYKYEHIIVKLLTGKNCSEITDIIKGLEKDELVEFSHYTTMTQTCTNDIWEPVGKKCVESYGSRFSVKVKDPEDLTDLNKIASETNTQIISQNRFMENWFVLNADKRSCGDGLQMANYFYRTRLFFATDPWIGSYVVEELD